MSGYTVTVDRAACDGIFACLVRDPRFVEDSEGLAAIDPESDTATVEERGDTVVATFADDRRDEAAAAAAACPLDAITVEDRDAADDSGGERECP